MCIPTDRRRGALVRIIGLPHPRLRTTTLCLASTFGARDDPPEAPGTAHLLEHALMSVPAGGGGPLADHVERLGGHANAETGPEWLLCYARVDPADAADVGHRLARAVGTPDLSEEQLAAQREVVLRELAAVAADPSQAAPGACLQRLFGGHPLGKPVGGTIEGVRELDAATVQRVHRETLLRRPMALVVVGPEIPAVDLGPLDGAGSPPEHGAGIERVPLPREPAGTGVAWPEEFAWICLGARTPGLEDPGFAAYRVLAALLGSSPSSLLSPRLRGDAALAYAFESWASGFTEAGAWRLLAGTEPQHGEAVVDAVRSTLAALADRGPDPAALDAARRQARMRLVVDAEDPVELAQLVAVRTRAGTHPWDVDGEAAALGAVTAGRIRAAAARVSEHLTAVVLPPAP